MSWTRTSSPDRSRARRPHRAVLAAPFVLAAAVAGALAVALTGCAAASEPDDDRDGALPADVQSALSAALDDTIAEYDVPGAVAGVWIPGEGSWTTAVGVADIESGEPTSTEMSWPLRSVTKSYTVTLLLQLVDEGMLSLDDTIGTYVDGVTDGDRITLRELAGMSSGNADYTGEEFLEEYIADPTRLFTLDELNAFVLGKPAQFAPGTEHVYTNANTNLLGAVIESVTGQPFDGVLQSRILSPLDLDDTRYLVDVADWAKPHPEGYTPGDEPRAGEPQNFSIFGPAGAMVSTLDDSRVWAEMLGTGALLEPETQAERLVGAPLDSGPPYDIYALGIGETDGWWGHNGEGLGFTSALFHDPQTGATIVVFANESNLADKTHPADEAFRRMAAVLAEQGASR